MEGWGGRRGGDGGAGGGGGAVIAELAVAVVAEAAVAGGAVVAGVTAVTGWGGGGGVGGGPGRGPAGSRAGCCCCGRRLPWGTSGGAAGAPGGDLRRRKFGGCGIGAMAGPGVGAPRGRGLVPGQVRRLQAGGRGRQGDLRRRKSGGIRLAPGQGEGAGRAAATTASCCCVASCRGTSQGDAGWRAGLAGRLAPAQVGGARHRRPVPRPGATAQVMPGAVGASRFLGLQASRPSKSPGLQGPATPPCTPWPPRPHATCPGTSRDPPPRRRTSGGDLRRRKSSGVAGRRTRAQHGLAPAQVSHASRRSTRRDRAPPRLRAARAPPPHHPHKPHPAAPSPHTPGPLANAGPQKETGQALRPAGRPNANLFHVEHATGAPNAPTSAPAPKAQPSDERRATPPRRHPQPHPAPGPGTGNPQPGRPRRPSATSSPQPGWPARGPGRRP